MPETDEQFLKRLLATFRIEADEHVSALAAGLLELERASAAERSGIIETIFREAHSLKGAARSVNLTNLESICASLESTFAALKQNEIALSPELLDTLHQTLDRLRALLSSAETEPAGQGAAHLQPPAEQRVSGRSELAPTAERLAPTAAATTPPTAGGDRMETVRISTARLDSLLRQAEELVSAKLATHQHAQALRTIKMALAQWKKQWGKIHPELRTLQRSLGEDSAAPGPPAGGTPNLRRLLDFVEWSETYMQSLEADFAGLEKPFERDHRALALGVDTLLNDLRSAAMLPFSSLEVLLRKLVRDLSREQGKLVNLVLAGGELEMDRRILEELKDPLIHLVRNSIDHGIEPPDARGNKPAPGTITVAAVRQDAKVEISVADDGAGIDVMRVREAAVAAAAVAPTDAEKLSDREAALLVFRSGLSTSPIVTDISGRGLGLAIVQEKVERLGGRVWIESRREAGATFRMLVPLTLSTFRGVVLRLGDRLFVLPTTHIERVLHVKQHEIQTVENRETLSLDGQTVPLVGLGNVLGLASNVASGVPPDVEGRHPAGRKPAENPPARGPSDAHSAGLEATALRQAGTPAATNATALVIGSAGQRIAFLVDEVRQEQEVVLKPLGKQLVRVRNLAGAAILGAGNVVPVLNVTDLMKSAMRAAPVTRPAAVAPRQEAKPAILVADDSITSRSLFKSILETNGYTVTTAVDGMDALTKIRSGEFGLIVSDIEMPRMNGFDLTARIRADKKFADLPVVLVTALESRADRERGIDVGANAYIVKSSFDQSNLLEIVSRLI